MKMYKKIEEKNDTRIKMLLMEGSPFNIRSTQRTGKNDLNKRRVSNSGHNEGTICLLRKSQWRRKLLKVRGAT